MSAYLDLLRPQVLTGVFKQVVASADPILGFMGFEPGGANERFYGHGREGAFHIFDDTRRVAKGRAPGTPAGRSEKQPMKAVPFTYPRMHDSYSLLSEFVHNLGRIDDPRQRDEAGKDMIMRQTLSLSQKAAAWRIAMTVGMLRDSLYVTENGDDWFVNYEASGALFQNPYRVPAGNKSQLNMTNRAGTSIYGANIIDIPWTSPGANIPDHIAKINAARANQGTGPVVHAHLNSIMWQNLTKNDYLTAQAGIANAPYSYYDRAEGQRPDETPKHEYIGKFNSLPGLTFHISDEGVETWNGTAYAFAKHWDDTQVVLMGEPRGTQKYTLYQGSEPIAEYDGGPETVRVGLSAWSKKTSNPTGTELYVLDNALPVPHDPFDIVIATVDFAG